MSITSALYTGVSGLINQGEAMNVIGNNISNVNTTGFKESRTLFSDLLSSNVGKGSQEGKGVQLQAVQNIFTQGTSQASANVTDLTIQGNNFFALQSPTSPATTQNTALLSRNGAFSVNKDLALVNADGYQVLDTSGKPIVFVNSGTSPSTDFGKITKIDSNGVITYLATDGVTQNYYNASAGTAGPDSADTVAASVSTYVASASAASASVTAASAADTAYATAATAASGSTDTSLIAAAAAALTAANSANSAAATAAKNALAAATAAKTAADAAVLASPSDAGLLAAQTAAGNAVTSAQASYTSAAAAALDTTGVTPNDATLAAAAVTDATALSKAAILVASATGATASRAVTPANATTVQRIALVHVTDPSALTKVGGSLYQSNADSGVATGTFSLASNSPNGTSEAILSNSLEASNVDMSTEFVNMITTQRAYSANSKTITTADQMTQEVLGLIR
jgi:flagellar hook protein FlgE